MSDKELLPCPFCGKHDDLRIAGFDGKFWISCDNYDCGCSLFNEKTEQEAINKWNTRQDKDDE